MPVLTEIMSDIQGQASQNTWTGEDNLNLTASPFFQLQFTCPTSKTVSDRVRAGVSTWRYQYQGNLFYTSFPWIVLQYQSRFFVGVFRDIFPFPDTRSVHGSEIPLVFGTFPTGSTNSPIPLPTAKELALSKYMQSAWVAFARDPAKGLLNFGWPLYDPNPRSNVSTLVELGGFYNQTGAAFAQGRLLDFTCGSQNVLGDVLTQLSVLLNDALSTFKSS